MLFVIVGTTSPFLSLSFFFLCEEGRGFAYTNDGKTSLGRSVQCQLVPDQTKSPGTIRPLLGGGETGEKVGHNVYIKNQCQNAFVQLGVAEVMM